MQVLLKTEVVVLEEEAGEAPSFTFEHKVVLPHV